MFNIKTLNKISPVGLDKFDRSKYTWGDDIENPDAILVRSASMHDMEMPKSLLAIARAGAGVNNIPVDKCAEEGIVVFNTPGANANAVKELVLLGMLICARKVTNALEWVKTLSGKGEEVGKLVEKGKSQFAGPELAGKTLGVIGLGAIGVKVANAATHLGMDVLGYDPYISVDGAWELSRSVKHAKTLKEIFEACDYITLHVPCNAETKGMINSESIATMKNGVRILNFARGELAVNADILNALESGKVAAYVTDFAADELIGKEGVVVLPHLGASTPESEDNCAKMAAAEIIDYLENGNIKNSVNMPAASMPKSGKARVCIIHKNIPAMVAQITAVFSDNGLNIENMQDKSRKDIAYTLLDIAQPVGTEIADKLDAIDGVVKVRII